MGMFDSLSAILGQVSPYIYGSGFGGGNFTDANMQGISQQQGSLAPKPYSTQTPTPSPTPSPQPYDPYGTQQGQGYDQGDGFGYGGMMDGLMGGIGSFGSGLSSLFSGIPQGNAMGNMNNGGWNQGGFVDWGGPQDQGIDWAQIAGNQMAADNLNGPQGMVDQMNGAIGSTLNANADRNFRNNIAQAIAGLGNGNRLGGFEDVNSGQFAKLPGAGNIAPHQTTITASAPTQNAINTSASAISNVAGNGFRLPNAVPASAKTYGAANNSFGKQLATAGGQAGLAFRHGATPAAAQLNLNAQQAAGQQGLGLANFNAGLNNDNIAATARRQGLLSKLV